MSKDLISSGARGQVFSPFSLCTGCKLAKYLALPFNSSLSQTTSPFQLVSDIWDLAPIPSRPGYFYYVSFVDNFTRFTWVYLMCQRYEI